MGDRALTCRVERSEGLLIAPFGAGVCCYDLLTDSVHVLGPAAASVLDRLPTNIGSLLTASRDLADSTTVDPEVELLRGVGALVTMGVLNRAQNYERPEPIHGSARDPAGRFTGASHDLLDQVLAFRSNDQDLVEEIDAFIGVVAQNTTPTVFFDADVRPDGGIDLLAAELWEFPSRSGFFTQLPGVVHDFAARSDASIVFHAGAVRTPDGRILLLSGPSESGKSTLVAALAQAGCDYMCEEMTGVRHGTLHALCYPTPLALDETSRSVLELGSSPSPHAHPRELRSGIRTLRGEVGPVAAVILPVFAPGAKPSVEHLGPIDALKALLENATNLTRAGDAGFNTLCTLAERVPVTRVVHRDTRALADSIMVGTPTSKT